MEATSNNWFTNKYPIGYALSGGFIKGFAHLGVMQSLLEHDIKPNILSGVSAGALAGPGTYARKSNPALYAVRCRLHKTRLPKPLRLLPKGY